MNTDKSVWREYAERQKSAGKMQQSFWLDGESVVDLRIVKLNKNLTSLSAALQWVLDSYFAQNPAKLESARNG